MHNDSVHIHFQDTLPVVETFYKLAHPNIYTETITAQKGHLSLPEICLGFAV